MDCLKCPLTDICTVYDMIKSKHTMIDINVSSCRYREKTIQQDKGCNIAVATREETTVIQPVAPVIKKYKDFRIEAKELSKGPELGNLQIVDEEQDPDIEINCPVCNATTYQSDIKVCSCGKACCSNCGTESEGKIHCEECWSKL